MNERPIRPDGDDELDTAPRARRRLLAPLDDAHDAEPSPELDRLVLSRARESLRLDRAPERHYRGPRWAAPVAIAATLVLSFGLVMQMTPKGDATLSSPDEGAIPGGSDATFAEAASAEGVAVPVPGPTRASRATPAPAPASAPAPAPAPAPASAPASFAAAAAAAQDAGQAASRAAKSVSDASALRAEAEGEQAVLADATAGPGAATTSAPDTPPEPSRASGAGTARNASQAASSRAIERAAPPADDVADGSGAAALPRADPQRWLAAIEQLQAAGNLDAARRELAAFRKRYPDQPLPPSLDRLQ
jgi:hypothetical protein